MSSCLFSELRLQECFSAAQTRKPPGWRSLLPHFSLLHHHHCWILCLCGVNKKWEEPQLRRPPAPPPSGVFVRKCCVTTGVVSDHVFVSCKQRDGSGESPSPCCVSDCQGGRAAASLPTSKLGFSLSVCECVCVVCLCQLHWKCHPWQTECLHDVHTVGSVREECFTRRNQNCWSTVFVHDASTAVDTDRKPTVSPHENDHIQHFTHTHTH